MQVLENLMNLGDSDALFLKRQKEVFTVNQEWLPGPIPLGSQKPGVDDRTQRVPVLCKPLAQIGFINLQHVSGYWYNLRQFDRGGGVQERALSVSFRAQWRPLLNQFIKRARQAGCVQHRWFFSPQTRSAQEAPQKKFNARLHALMYSCVSSAPVAPSSWQHNGQSRH
jgi:hypothetical protein